MTILYRAGNDNLIHSILFYFYIDNSSYINQNLSHSPVFAIQKITFVTHMFIWICVNDLGITRLRVAPFVKAVINVISEICRSLSHCSSETFIALSCQENSGARQEGVFGFNLSPPDKCSTLSFLNATYIYIVSSQSPLHKQK